MAPARSPGRNLALVLLLVLVAALPRLTLLEADPAVRLSPGLLADEGWWAQNARQHALFGKWVMDEHNPALYVAPVYTMALRGVYALAGVGLWQTRLVSALAGVLTCLALYLALRAMLPPRRAVAPALVLALSLMAVTLNRVAYTESLQLLLLTLTVAGVLWSARYPAAGIVGGLTLVLAVLCKPNALVFVPIIAGFWAGELWIDRGTEAGWRQRLRPMVVFTATTLVAAGAVALLVLALAPNWSEVRHQLGISLANVYGVDRRVADGGALFFFLPWLGLHPTLLTTATLVPLLGVIVLAWRRLTLSGVGRADPPERLMWWWLGGAVLFQALQSYQPDRRFLVLLVPVVALGWRGLVEEGLRVASGPARAGWLRHLLAGALGGGVVGLLCLGWWTDALIARFGTARIDGGMGISPGLIQQALWHVPLVLGVGGALLCWRWAPRRGWAVRAWLWLPLWLALEPGQVVSDLRHATYSRRAAAQSLARISTHLPADRRAITGDLANTMALGTDLFAFRIRNEPRIGALMNLNGWERFRPALLVSTSRNGRANPRDTEPHGFIPLCTFRLRLGRDGRSVLEATFWHAPDVTVPALCPPGARPGL